MSSWKRAGFVPYSDEHVRATELVTTNVANTHIALLMQDHRSVWAVDQAGGSVNRALGAQGIPPEPVPPDIDAMKAYIYFSPGTYEALADVFPRDFHIENCERPPRHLVSGMVHKDDDFSYWFGSQTDDGKMS